MTTYTPRTFQKLLKQNGFEKVRMKGGHIIWKRGNDVVSVPCHEVNILTAQRMINKYNLIA